MAEIATFYVGCKPGDADLLLHETWLDFADGERVLMSRTYTPKPILRLVVGDAAPAGHRADQRLGRTMTPSMREGTAITCEHGHAVCTLARDVFDGDEIGPAMFKDWRIQEPSVGEAADLMLCDCGGRYLDWTCGKLHTAQGWQPA